MAAQDKIRVYIERMWTDIAGLPWKDKSWTGNAVLMEQTKQHYVGAAFHDVMLAVDQMELIEKTALRSAISILDKEMGENPSRELANAINQLTVLAEQGEADAPVTSKDS